MKLDILPYSHALGVARIDEELRMQHGRIGDHKERFALGRIAYVGILLDDDAVDGRRY